MQKTIIVFTFILLALLGTGCETECKTVTTRNITVLVDATDSLLITKAQNELRKENFKQLINEKLGLKDGPKCFTVNYDFGIISTHSFYNPVSTELSHTNWGEARNKLILRWRNFYKVHEDNLQRLDSVGVMENTSLFPTLMKAINKTDGTIIVVSDLIENNPVVNFYKKAPSTVEEMDEAYKDMVAYYLPDHIGPGTDREVIFIVISEPKDSGVVHKARAFWKYALEQNLGLDVSFADGLSTL